MHKFLQASALALSLAVLPAAAHHPAADIVDEEIWQMIDALVADTPHADMIFDDMGGGMTETTITTGTAGALANMLDNGGLAYLQMLSGDVQISIDFNGDGSATLTATQLDY